MSTSTSYPNKIHKNPFHRRNDSGELHVFEAARYFSTADHGGTRPARRSLDVPIMIRPSNQIPREYDHHQLFEQKQEQNKKFKQPSSPGGRLASFLNSLFNQASLKKKKKSKSGAAAKEVEEERRKRRSSISHFRITTTASKNATANTPTKSYKELMGREKKGADCERIEGRKELRKWNEEDNDGGESDSSSDLFDLDFFSSGLPVYETTHIQRITITTPT